MRVTDVESSQKAVEQLLNEVQDVSPSGPRTLAEQLEDVRGQCGELRGELLAATEGKHLEVQGNGEMDRAQNERQHRRNLEEVNKRLAVMERHVDANSERILQQVSEDLACHRQDLEKSVSELSAQLLVIDGRTQQSLTAALAPNTALGATVAAFCNEFRLQADSLEVMDDQDLQDVDVALQQQLRELCSQEVSPCFAVKDQDYNRAPFSGSVTSQSFVEDRLIGNE